MKLWSLTPEATFLLRLIIYLSINVFCDLLIYEVHYHTQQTLRGSSIQITLTIYNVCFKPNIKQKHEQKHLRTKDNTIKNKKNTLNYNKYNGRCAAVGQCSLRTGPGVQARWYSSTGIMLHTSLLHWRCRQGHYICYTRVFRIQYTTWPVSEKWNYMNWLK